MSKMAMRSRTCRASNGRIADANELGLESAVDLLPRTGAHLIPGANFRFGFALI